MRYNYSFEQMLAWVRKNEREHILGLLEDHLEHLEECEEWAEANAVRAAIDTIETDTSQPVRLPDSFDGTPQGSNW